MELSQLINNILDNKSLILAILAVPSFSSKTSPNKVSIRPIQLKDKFLYQLSEYINEQVFHRNVSQEKCKEFLMDCLTESKFRQAILYTLENDFYINCSDDKCKITKKPPTKQAGVLAHNRQKQYWLEDNTPLPFLIELGLMNSNGKIFSDKMAKFRQVNRFLEIVEDILPHFQDKSLSLIDLGCGKAYLTFALYYFLNHLKGYEVKLVGIDRKIEIVQFCNELAKKLNFEGLTFIPGNISDYPTEKVDIAVALHACDTATDEALIKAYKCQAKAILSAPCCQHELYHQISSKALQPILQHGILKERLAAIATDAARAQILEILGYKTQILEFVDPEHTPKNLLIRALYGNTESQRAKALQAYNELKHSLSVKPYLEQLIGSYAF